MNRNRKKTLIVVLSILVLVAVLIIIYHVSQKETYLSEDPLYGSFTIENREPSDDIYPADFLISVDVATSDRTLVKRAQENNVDISKGCWVYSFDEDKIFEAEKEGNKLQVYEDDKVIGVFEYSSSKILWITYDEKYTADWRGTKLDLKKVLQGFAFP